MTCCMFSVITGRGHVSLDSLLRKSPCRDLSSYPASRTHLEYLMIHFDSVCQVVFSFGFVQNV
jgi:hypothetical protein